MTERLELTTAEAIKRIKDRIEGLRRDYCRPGYTVTPYRIAEDIMESMCDMLRGGFTR